MKYWQCKNNYFKRYVITAFIGVALCTCTAMVIAADYDGDEMMMLKLFEFHSKLAKQGNLESVTRLGVMYERGEGVEKNRNKAIELYRYAVNGGYKPANELLTSILSNKTGTSSKDLTLDSIRVPIPKNETPTDDTSTAAIEQQAPQIKLEQEQEAALEARDELEKLQQSRQDEAFKQQQLEQEIQNVKQAQEQLAQEQAKAEAVRQEMELLRKQQEEEIIKQELFVGKQLESEPEPTQTQVKENKSETTRFSSNPCNTPAARFMSTCN